MEHYNYTAEELSGFGIFELRHIARKVGVKSPTTLKKEDIITQIMLITNGQVAPSAPSKRGRPPRALFADKDEYSAPEKDKRVMRDVTVDYEVDRTAVLTERKASADYAAEGSVCRGEIKSVDAPPAAAAEPERIKYTRAFETDAGKDDRPTMQKFGVLDILADGYGFLRAENCEPGAQDAYISAKYVRSMGLRRGDFVVANAKFLADNRPPGVVEIVSVNGLKPEKLKQRPYFDNLIPVYPDNKLNIENSVGRTDFAIRMIDLIAPIGKGQRAMIVSPPKAGKTTLLKKIANAITENNPEVILYVLLIDERPEEVTDMQRSIKGDVIYSTFDETPEHHTKASELLIERAKRNVELGRDVVIIMDSLTRLARAYNITVPQSGRTLSGGIDPSALQSPKRFFGAARNIEFGGSLTIIATALVDTGSRMDEVIFEEFKGTGNMEIHLDRKLSEKRIFPAIDFNKSSTRREDLLLNAKQLNGAYGIRKMLSSGENQEIIEKLIDMIVKTKCNNEFIDVLDLQLRAWEKNGYKRI